MHDIKKSLLSENKGGKLERENLLHCIRDTITKHDLDLSNDELKQLLVDLAGHVVVNKGGLFCLKQKITKNANLQDETIEELVKEYNDLIQEQSPDGAASVVKPESEEESELALSAEKSIEVKSYSYPVENAPAPVYSKDPKFAPFGTQWLYDVQTDDVILPHIEKRGIQFDKLRKIVLPEQRTPAWFQMREGKITASDGGTVIGVNPYAAPYTFITKKVTGGAFETNKACYHGKKYEEVATQIYANRNNVDVEEFGLMGHPTISFLGASPDGICSRYKRDKKHLSNQVGKMLEIKCPLMRKIKTEGEIYGNICPAYYWVQVQLQLECCELDECDFWQCTLHQYKNRDEFIQDTDPDQPTMSITSGLEKGAIIEMLPIDKINGKIDDDFVYNNAAHIYAPHVNMTPFEIDKWVNKTLCELPEGMIFYRVCYWRLDKSHNVTIMRDREWFEEKLPLYQKAWNYVTFFRKNPEKFKIITDFIDSIKIKKNERIMALMEAVFQDNKKEIDQILNETVKKDPAPYLFLDSDGPPPKVTKTVVSKDPPKSSTPFKKDKSAGAYMFVDSD